MSLNETKKEGLEEQLRLSNVRMLLLLDQANLLSLPLPSPIRVRLWVEYRQAELRKYAE